MSASLARSLGAAPPSESPDRVPLEVARLLAAVPGHHAEDAWSAFVACYSGLLLKVATSFAPGYDGALDRYAFMLDELRRADCRRLRAFAADGRGRFSTWLTVVARRLCLDHYRQTYGRFRGLPSDGAVVLARNSRRSLARLEGAVRDLAEFAAPSSPDPADELDRRERCAALQRAVALLPPGDQLLLRLRFEQDLTGREMATMLGLPTPFHVYRRLDAVYRVMRNLIGVVENDEAPRREDGEGLPLRARTGERAKLTAGPTRRKYSVAPATGRRATTDASIHAGAASHLRPPESVCVASR